jgi:hypothetical protein
VRVQVDEANKKSLDRIPGAARIYPARDSGPERAKLNDSFLAQETLNLKIGARVMYIKNHKTRAGLVNGTLGNVVDWHIDEHDSSYAHPVVEFDGVGSVVVEDECFMIENRSGAGEPAAQRIQVCVFGVIIAVTACACVCDEYTQESGADT